MSRAELTIAFGVGLAVFGLALWVHIGAALIVAGSAFVAAGIAEIPDEDPAAEEPES